MLPTNFQHPAVEKLNELATKFNVEKLAKFVTGDPRFPLWSGSAHSHQHHYGKGGLATHTLEVVELCLLNNGYYKDILNPTDLYLSALFHDAGKMWDYQPVDSEPFGATSYQQWEGANHKRIIHHISRSGLVWHDAATACGIDEQKHDEILHAILAHHGLREWGSPVSPKSRLAWFLHLCDGISARNFDADTWDRVKG